MNRARVLATLALCGAMSGCDPDASAGSREPRSASEPDVPAAPGASDSPEVQGGADAVSPAPADTPPAGTLEYRLEWDFEGVTRHPDGGFSLVNDLGHRLYVTRAWISSHSARLVPCEVPDEGTLASRLARLFVGVAHAGHDEAAPDPSTTPTGRVEDLARATDSLLGTVHVANPTGPYCHVHYLVADAAESAAGLPAETRMVGVSLHVEGTVERDGEAPTEFQVRTRFATGRSDALRADGEALALDLSTASAVVHIRRRVAKLFARVDLTAGDHVRTAALLAGLADATTLDVERR